MSLDNITIDFRTSRLLKHQLKMADHAFSRMNHADPDGALHDFRVALRRIRSRLRLYRDEFKGIRAILRRLRKLSRTCDAARDEEVWLTLLDKLAEGCRRQELEGINQIRDRLIDQMNESRQQTREAIEDHYPSIRDDLHELAQRSADCDEKVGLYEQANDLCRVLETSLGGLLPDMEVGCAHRTRILIMRLRYFMESERELYASEDIDDAVAALKSLQSLLGQWRDAKLLGDWLSETAAVCCGMHARKLVRAAMHDDIHAFAVLQAHELLSGLVYVATGLNAHVQMLYAQLEAWFAGPEYHQLKVSSHPLKAIPVS